MGTRCFWPRPDWDPKKNKILGPSPVESGSGSKRMRISLKRDPKLRLHTNADPNLNQIYSKKTLDPAREKNKILDPDSGLGKVTAP